MDCTRNKIKELAKYIQSFGIVVNFKTQARGHQGFFLKNRIDISKKIPDEKIIPTLLHEFAHFIYSKDESFKTDDIINELFCVTNFVDENSKFILLKTQKEIVKKKILEQEKIIKQEYPNFMRSKKFKEFDKFIKHSKAKYLLRYDRIKYITPFLRRTEYYSIDKLEQDFNMPTAFYAYIRLKSLQRKQTRISAKINRLKKYYLKPTELFARLIEGLYINKIRVQNIAPLSFKRYEELVIKGHYNEIETALSMVLK